VKSSVKDANNVAMVQKSGSSLFCVDISIKTNGELELKIVLSIKNDEEPKKFTYIRNYATENQK